MFALHDSRSISARFSVAMIAAVSLVLLLFVLIAFFWTNQRINDDLKEQLTGYLSVSASALALPRWNLDLEIEAGVVDALMVDRDIVYARLEAEGETVILRNRKGYEDMDYSIFMSSDKFVTGTVPIVFEESNIGELELVLSRDAAVKQLWYDIISILLLAVLIIAAISLTSIAVARTSVATPLAELQQYAAAVAAGKVQKSINIDRHDEIGRLATDLNVMGDSIQNLLNRLRSSNEELETANRTLEERVEERTASVELAQHRLIDAIDSASEGFAFFDNDDRLVLSNQRFSELVGRSGETEDMIGRTFESLVRQAVERGRWKLDVHDDDAAEQFINSRLQSFGQAGTTVALQRSDGGWVQVNERSTRDGGTVGIYSDLTAIKQHEAELASMVEELEIARDQAMDATVAKSRFLANMSHELRTPLNAIIGYSELLHDDATDMGQSDFIPDLENIRDAGKHLLGLINDILDLSKIEAGKMTVHREEFSIASMIDDVKSVIEPVLVNNNNTLKVAADSNLGMMLSDQTKLRQNLLNLLSNATKFTEQGRIELSVKRFTVGVDAGEDDKGDDESIATEWIEFVVSDTGIGMTDEQLEKLFQAFAQADSSITRDYGGTGLGLAISKEFCLMLGGTISAKSVLGQGSTFTMRLPVECPDADNLPINSAAEPDSPSYDGSEYSVLVIDDDVQIRDLLVDNLTRHGYRVFTAGDGRSGLEMAKLKMPDVITLDIVMGDLDGWSVLSALKNDEALCNIPVVLITIMADRDMGYALGAVDYITKPFDQESVVEAVRRAHLGEDAVELLVVDDSESSRSILKRALIRVGYSVLEAADGKRALEIVKTTPPAAILLDIMMPEMNGFEFLEQLRADDTLADIPVIIVSARDFDQEEMQQLNERVLEVFQKGAYERQQLVETVKKLVDQRLESKVEIGAQASLSYAQE